MTSVDDWSFQQTHKDFRSLSRASCREKKQMQKYYGYRGVKPSWIGQHYYHVPEDNFTNWFESRHMSDPIVTYPEAAVIKKWTKLDMWQEHDWNIWPLDCRHHRGKVAREGHNGWTEKKFRAEARHIQSAVEGGDRLFSDVDHDLRDILQVQDQHQCEVELVIEANLETHILNVDHEHDDQSIEEKNEAESIVDFDMVDEDAPEKAVSDDGWDIVQYSSFDQE